MSHVPLARCSETGLLLLCLSTFQEDLPECVKHLRDPKARPRSRPLKPQGSVAQEQQSLARVLDPGTHSGSGEGTGDRPSPVAMVLLAPVPNYEGLVNGCFCSNTSVYYNKPANEWPNIIIFTGGARYQFDAQGRDRKRINHKDGWVDAFPVAVRNFNVRLHDLRGLNDPHEGAFSQCVGRHPGILEGVLSSPAGRHILTSCFKDIEMAVDGHKPLVVLPYCTSNRHRSVAIGTLISAGLYVLGMDHFLGHLHANASWAEMKCGGKCAKCRGHFDHAEATQLGNSVLAQLDPQVTRYATHPVDRQRSRGGGGTVPDPAAHSAPPPATRHTLDWRDRAIRAEALLERVKGELQETKDRNVALELRIQDLETQNRNLYGQACVAEQWNEWFQDQQEKGTTKRPRNTRRGVPLVGLLAKAVVDDLPAGDLARRTMVATSPGALRRSGLDLAFSGEARWAIVR